ncbi:hypothetical protein FB567DRAFT_538189 [Paraphoma chrysanthemicola]|uniref:Uncharacterized protein n=1 Tax=Paraphoma chrysanthemicola TaxID=798071 RepID=A0A8K0QV60_9PLEO|nr:hypothetical protein FB567DRAFT_538189 [Paraphoma chrysanthemicola]
MAEEQAAHHLLNVLEERGLNVDLDKILLGFEDEATKHDVATWVEEYLHEDTLLTREELELYQTLKKRNLLHQYESEGEPQRPILDHEIAVAIESLQTSTAAIEAQCKVLEAQKEALTKLKALDKPNLDVEHARNERRRKEGQEKARLDVAADDIAGAITEQLTESQREIDTEKASIKIYLSERLASDDQILGRLPGIVSKLVAENEGSQDEKSIEQWCTAIIAFRTREIKARVDAVYLNSLSKFPPNGHSETPDEELKERKSALQAEMEELHSEIASITEMVVEHELRKPMNEMKDRNNREVTQARGAWLKYVLSTLEYMGRRLDTVTSSMKDTEELQQVLSHFEAAASKRMPDTHAPRPTPPRRRTTSGPLSAFTPMVKLKPTKSLDLPVALQDALRHAGIPFNQDSIEALQDAVVNAQFERQRKLHDHFNTASVSSHERLAERSRQADGDVRVILDALYKHTPFQQVSLSDPQVEEQLKVMDKELEAKDGELLDAEANELSLGDPKVKRFIAKYGK